MNASLEPSPIAAPAAAGGEDAVWAGRLAARDPGALREMIARYAAALHRVAFRMTGEACEAEDIVQEAMLRLWDQAPSIAARYPVGSQAAAHLRLGGWL